jgi:hypothetical protein
MVYCGRIRNDARLCGNCDGRGRVVACDDKEANPGPTTYPAVVVLFIHAKKKVFIYFGFVPDGIWDIRFQRVDQAHETDDDEPRVELLDKLVETLRLGVDILWQ